MTRSTTKCRKNKMYGWALMSTPAHMHIMSESAYMYQHTNKGSKWPRADSIQISDSQIIKNVTTVIEQHI